MKNRPGKGLLGWLGRQVGYVTGATKADVGAKVLYRNRSVEEKRLPGRPDVLLRRTTLDEVVRQRANVQKQKKPSDGAASAGDA